VNIWCFSKSRAGVWGLILVPLFLILAVSNAVPAKKTKSEKVIQILTFHDPQSKALFDLVREFERATGIVVEMKQFRGAEMLSKENLEDYLGGFDLVTVDEPYLCGMADYLLPLKDWPKPVWFPQINLETNWHPQAVKGCQVGNVAYGVPVNPNVYFYAYRKDLFKDEATKSAFENEYGYALAPPKSAQEYHDIAEFFYRPPRLFGFSPIEEMSEAMTIELIWTLSLFGEPLFDAELRPAFDPVVAEEALKWYRSLLAFAPPRSERWHYEERAELMGAGLLAHGMFWPAFLSATIDPEDSMVSGSMGYSLGPLAPDGSPVNLTGFWTIGIPILSKNPEWAVEFAAFWCERKTNIRMMRRGGVPNRTDVLNDERMESALPWVDTHSEALKLASSRPQHKDYPKISQIAARIFAAFTEGKLSAKEAASELMQIGLKSD